MATLREEGVNPYPTTATVTHTAAQLQNEHGEKSAEQLEEEKVTVTVAGRVKAIRNFGSAIFIDVYDRTGKVQGLVAKKLVGPEKHKHFKKMADVGDIYWFTGWLMKTRTGELSVAATDYQLLGKNVRPLPEKFHGLSPAVRRPDHEPGSRRCLSHPQ